METIDLTLPTPQLNLACDEALLEMCERGHDREILRFWEPTQTFVVLGYSNKARVEANTSACARDGIPILRRCSGGGAVLQGPGCLNYTLVLRIDDNGPTKGVTETNCHVMRRHRDALQPLVDGKIEIGGHSDLAIGGLKFSGNSQRRRKHFLLFHGTFLYRLDLAQVGKYLNHPSREPEYRQKREHEDFLANLKLPPQSIKEAVIGSWQPTDAFKAIPTQDIGRLAQEKYSREEWNLKF